MTKTDVLVIGGGAAGITVALTAKQNYSDKDVTVVRKEQKALVPCGIPYIFGTLGSVDRDVISDEIFTRSGVNLIIDEIIDVDLKAKRARTGEHGEIAYEKLAIATGSRPIAPSIKGIDRENIFQIYKEAGYLETLRQKIEESRRIVIVGGGFIGVEFADEVRKLNKEVAIIEMLPHVLQLSFDDEFCELAEAELRNKGVEIYTDGKIAEFTGGKSVDGVSLSTGQRIAADLVILSIGVKTDVGLARKMGLKVTEYGVEVDEYMRTSERDVFAVGDCAEKRDFFTRKPKSVLLASVATAESRTAGANLYQLKAFKQFKGTLGIFATKVGDLSLGAAGLIERSAREEAFDYVVGTSEVADKHPASLPATNKVFAKLIFTKQSGSFLGGQLAGGDTIGEMINLLGFAIESGYIVARFVDLQIGTHPLLTPSPISPATIKAAADALRKIYM